MKLHIPRHVMSTFSVIILTCLYIEITKCTFIYICKYSCRKWNMAECVAFAIENSLRSGIQPRPKTIFCFEELSWWSEGDYRFYVTVVTETASTNMLVPPEKAINNTFVWHNDSVYHINTEPKPEYYQIKVQNRKIKAIPNRTIITKPSS